VVSHDRYFMDKMVDHLFVFDGAGEINDVFGNYTIYRKELASSLKEEKKQDQLDAKKAQQEVVIESTPKVKETPVKKKMSFKEKEEFKNIEKELERLEELKNSQAEKLTDSSLSSNEMMELGATLSKTVEELETKTNRWLELSELDAF